MANIDEFLYKGKVRIISLPKRELSPGSEYPKLIGLKGKIIRISGNRLGISIDGKINENSDYGCYWFDLDNVEKVEEKSLKTITIKIPKEFKNDFNNDRFEEFFERVSADIDNTGLCGNYEKETAEMLKEAFKKAIVK